jgi:photosystem II stability/assembly factor-like uncharacterized protein
MDEQQPTQQENQTSTPTTAPGLTPPINKKRKHLIIVIATLLLAVGGGVAYLLQNKDTESISTEQSQEVSQSSDLSIADQLMAKYPNDVVDIQSFDCAPRTDDEWYRTDHTLAVDPNNPDVMYVSIEWKGVFKSVDGGKTWQEKTNGILAYARNDDKSKRCFGEYPVIRINPADSNHLILVTSGGGGGFLSLTEPNSQTGGIYQSFDSGDSWELATGDNMNIYATDAVFSSDGSSIFYATSSSPASWTGADQTKKYVDKGLILTSNDKAKTWTELPTGVGERTSVTNIHISPDDPNILVAPTFSAERTSSDGSGTGISDGKNLDVTQLGILTSQDGGKTWSTVAGSTNHAVSSSFVSKQVFNNQFFVVSNKSTEDPFSYVTVDGAKTLTKAKNLDLVAYDPHDSTGKHMLGFSSITMGPSSQNLTLWESKDSGLSWTRTGTLPSEISDPNSRKTRISKIVWHPTDKNTVFTSGAGGYVWKSTDLGSTWQTLLSVDKL